MWWIVGFVALCTAIAVVISRRGSTGASRADDLPSSHQPEQLHGGLPGGVDGFGNSGAPGGRGGLGDGTLGGGGRGGGGS